MNPASRSWRIIYFKSRKGEIPFQDWLSKLRDPIARAKIRTRFRRMELGNFGIYKILNEGVCELKFSNGPGYRVYFSFWKNEIILLLAAGDKSTQSADIEFAIKNLKEHKNAPRN
jgi:putative addiction module killer protein